VDPTEGGLPQTTIFSLRLYDFDIDQALRRKTLRATDQNVLTNCRILVNRALLYNDGGFDVSPCGQYLCACAEYWLPNNISCATELFPKEEHDDDSCSDDKDISTQSDDLLPTMNQDATPLRRRQRNNRYPITPPPITYRQYIPLSPPPPPGRRLPGGLDPNPNFQMRRQQDQLQYRPITKSHISPAAGSTVEGKIIPHVVTISLTPSKLGQLLEAAPLDKRKASGVTCVKFSPSAEYCLLGYGVRETTNNRNSTIPPHTVTAVYRIKGGMKHVSTLKSLDDDVNIARFHPHSGHGFVYGTKQGRLRVMSPKPWNYFCRDS